MEKAPVLIAGGGPVGLMMALELNYHGIDAILVERNQSTTRHPKMDITNGRSMELYRRLGVSDMLRKTDNAVPEDHPMSVVWVDDLKGHVLARFDYPCVADRRKELREINDGSLAAEPSMRISQVHLEPALKGYIEKNCQHIDCRFGWGLKTFEQDSDGVTATVINSETSETLQIRADYLVGTDGAGSITRRTLGIPINTIIPSDFFENGSDPLNHLDSVRGEPPKNKAKPATAYMIHFTSPERELFERDGPVWHLQSVKDWNIIAQNDKDTWTFHYRPEDFEALENLSPKEILFQAIGHEFECDVLVANPWQPTLGLADNYGQGRVWLAGDAVRQVIPTGGYGMNTGVADAHGLAWVIAANINGWGGTDLFEAYEVERRHAGGRARLGSARHRWLRTKICSKYDPLLHEDSSAGQAKREELGRFILEAGNLENEAWGIEWGYRYDKSPIICHEGGEAPSYKWEQVEPSTWPGVRAPNVFLKSGEPIHDLFGKGFTLLNFGDDACDIFSNEAEKLDIPLNVIVVKDSHAANIYQQKLVLIRPDQHVAWRGDVMPVEEKIQAVLLKVTGRA